MGDYAIEPLMENSPHHFNETLEYQILLYEIMLELQQAERFFDVFPSIEEKLESLLKSEHVLVYKRGRHKRELSTTLAVDGRLHEVRIDFSPASIAGYVAMTARPLCIQDLADEKALHAIHPNLTNDLNADKELGITSKSTLCVPIHHNEILIGVLQLINRVDGSFSTHEYRKVTSLATMLGEHFYEELGMTEGPFDLLVQRGLVSRSELDDAAGEAARSDHSIAWQLVTELGIPAQDVGESLESYYQVPFLQYDINTRVPAKLIEDINPEYIKKQGWVPIADNGVEVTVLIDDPTDTQRIMDIERLFRNQKIKLFLMMPEDIAQIADAAIAESTEDETLEQLTDLADREVRETVRAKDGTSSELHDSGVGKLLNRIIVDAYSRGASDIHIQPSRPGKPARVLYRVDGVCRPVTKIPHKLVQPLTARLKVMCSMDIAEKRLPQDGKCSVTCRGKPLELRVAMIPNVHGQETAVLRLLSNCEAMHLYGLGLSDENLARIRRLSGEPHGLFLVVGPTGSGKTTTLHAILGHINNGERVIWTVEDPVEITQPGLQQVSINRKQGLTFANALRAFLRADPDVILVGEMRDAETAHIGIDAAMTGHLVMSTLHTNSAAETINRLLSLGIESFNLADALAGILSQRLVRRLCPDCKREYRPKRNELDFLQHFASTYCPEHLPAFSEETVLYEACGCEHCDDTGYRGRVGLHEVLAITRDLKELIASGAHSSRIEKEAINNGMTTLAGDALGKLIDGDIDVKQLNKVASS